MKRFLLTLASLAFLSCKIATVPSKPPVLVPPSSPATVTFDTVICSTAPVDNHCNAPIAGATVKVNTAAGVYDTQTSNADGYNLWIEPAVLVDSELVIDAPGFKELSTSIHPPTMTGQHNIFQLTPSIPPPPTRDELLDVHITFQGLMIQCPELGGTVPSFEGANAWMSDSCRASLYAAKHASTAWPGGDTHAIIGLPAGGAPYDEPAQPYQQYGPLDWTAGGISPLLGQRIVELAQHGFNRILLFLSGDADYSVAAAQLPLVEAALAHDPAGDLRRYVCIGGGWDGVWHAPDRSGTGWSREQIIAFGQQFRALDPNGCLFLEVAGYLPLGDGEADFNPGGAMSTYDLTLEEFAGPNDAAWRQTVINQSPKTYNGTAMWQIASRLSQSWTRPADEPADADWTAPPKLTNNWTTRGPGRDCAFEWVGLYKFIRGQETVAGVNADRTYLQSLGYRCGG